MIINWRRTLMAIAYGLMENVHYGWNVMPQSDGEMVADGIFMLLVASAIVVKP